MRDKLLEAVRHGDATSLQSIAESECSVEPFIRQPVPNDLRWSILHLAVSLKHNHLIEPLLHLDIGLVGQRDRYGWTALHLAIRQGNLFALEIMLSKKAARRVTTLLGEGLAFAAVSANQPRIVRYLMAQGVDFTRPNQIGEQPISRATHHGYLTCLKILIKSSAYTVNGELTRDFRSIINSLVNIALENHRIDMADYLLANYSTSNISFRATLSDDVNQYKALYRLMTHPNELIMRPNQLTLIDRLNNENLSLLIAALRILLSLKRDVPLRSLDHHINQLFEQIIKRVHWETLVTVLIQRYHEVDDVLQFLSKQYKIRSKDSRYYCLLREQSVPVSWIAAEEDDPSLLEKLLKVFGKNLLTATDAEGNSLLQYSSLVGAINVLNHLNRHYSQSFSVYDINARQETLVHCAVKYDQAEMVDLLIEQYQVGVDAQDTDLNSALHLATQLGHQRCIKRLLSVKANINLKNRRGETPLFLATGREDNLDFLYQTAPQKSSMKHSMLSPPKRTRATHDWRIAVFQGGGVKGIGYMGALKKLVEWDYLDLAKLNRVAGTSVGAIIALLLAIGYDTEELENVLRQIRFDQLLDDTLRERFLNIKKIILSHNGLEKLVGKNLFNLLYTLKKLEFDKLRSLYISVAAHYLKFKTAILEDLGIHGGEARKIMAEIDLLWKQLQPFYEAWKINHGLFHGEVLRQQFVRWIQGKQLSPNLTFRELHTLAENNDRFKDLYVAAYNADKRVTEVFSWEDSPDMIVADAVRCSMSIQGLFIPHRRYRRAADGRRVKDEKNTDCYFDGGSLDNYLLRHFDRERYLSSSNDKVQPASSITTKVSNPDVIGFRLLSPSLYAFYEEKMMPAEQKQKDNLLHWGLNVLHSLFSFTKQENDYKHHPDEQARTVHINTLDIGTVEFDITEERREKLIQSGERGAIAFLKRFKPLPQPVPISRLHQFIPKNPNSRFFYYLSLAKETNGSNFYELIKCLNQSIGDIIDSAGDTLIHYAVKQGDVVLLKRLNQVAVANDFEKRNKQGRKPVECIEACSDARVKNDIRNIFTKRKSMELPELASIAHSSVTSSAQSLNNWFGCWAAGSKDFDVSGLPFDQAIQKAITVSLRDRRESAKMPPSNDSEAQLTKAAARYGYKRHNVAKDGNCFFHAVAHQLNRLRVEGDHETLRLQAAIEVAAHPGYYGRFMTDNFNKTVKEMAQSGIWAGQLATQAIARLKQVIIVVIPHDGSRPSVMKPRGATQVIVLGNQMNYHFQSLISQQAKTAVTPAVFKLIVGAEFLEPYSDEQKTSIHATRPTLFGHTDRKRDTACGADEKKGSPVSPTSVEETASKGVGPTI